MHNALSILSAYLVKVCPYKAKYAMLNDSDFLHDTAQMPSYNGNGRIVQEDWVI